MTTQLDIDLAIQALADIRELGILAAPEEACGLIVVQPDKNVVIPLENRAEDPCRDVVMSKDDILDCVIEQFGSDWFHLELHDRLMFWHTHPGGHDGPSEVDLAQRETMSQWRMGVMTIPSGRWVEY